MCVCVSGVLPTFSKHRSLDSVLVGYREGQVTLRDVGALVDFCECVRVLGSIRHLKLSVRRPVGS